MKYKLSSHAKDVMEHRRIKEQWVYSILEEPFVEISIAKNEVHLFGTIQEYNERCLKVVINPLTNRVITTYFDRKMQKKGCQ